MPYKSDAQRKFFNANRANRDKLENQGVNVDEWNEESKGLKLPERIRRRLKRKKKKLSYKEKKERLKKLFRQKKAMKANK